MHYPFFAHQVRDNVLTQARALAYLASLASATASTTLDLETTLAELNWSPAERKALLSYLKSVSRVSQFCQGSRSHTEALAVLPAFLGYNRLLMVGDTVQKRQLSTNQISLLRSIRPSVVHALARHAVAQLCADDSSLERIKSTMSNDGLYSKFENSVLLESRENDAKLINEIPAIIDQAVQEIGESSKPVAKAARVAISRVITTIVAAAISSVLDRRFIRSADPITLHPALAGELQRVSIPCLIWNSEGITFGPAVTSQPLVESMMRAESVFIASSHLPTNESQPVFAYRVGILSAVCWFMLNYDPQHRILHQFPSVSAFMRFASSKSLLAPDGSLVSIADLIPQPGVGIDQDELLFTPAYAYAVRGSSAVRSGDIINRADRAASPHVLFAAFDSGYSTSDSDRATGVAREQVEDAGSDVPSIAAGTPWGKLTVLTDRPISERFMQLLQSSVTKSLRFTVPQVLTSFGSADSVRSVITAEVRIVLTDEDLIGITGIARNDGETTPKSIMQSVVDWVGRKYYEAQRGVINKAFQAVDAGLPVLTDLTRVLEILEGVSPGSDGVLTDLKQGIADRIVATAKSARAALSTDRKVLVPILSSLETIHGGSQDRALYAWDFKLEHPIQA